MSDISARNVSLSDTLDNYRNEIAQLKYNNSALRADFETEKKKAQYYDGERVEVLSTSVLDRFTSRKSLRSSRYSRRKI